MRSILASAAIAVSQLEHGQETETLQAPPPTSTVGTPAGAEEPGKRRPPLPAPAEWTVTAECLMVLVPQQMMLEWVPAFSSYKTASAAWEHIRQKIQTNEVKLLADFTAVGSSGDTLHTESTEEYSYVSEFEAPQLPEKVPVNQPLEVLKSWPLVGIAPKQFQTQKVGQTLDVNPDVSKSGDRIQVGIEIQHDRLARMAEYDVGRLANGEKLVVKQPVFHHMRSSSLVQLRNEQKILLGVHRAPAPEEGFELFLFTIKVDRVHAAP